MDDFNRNWIIEKALPIVKTYGGNITLRALHYRLVALYGFTNTIRHYKRVIGAMTQARWDGMLYFSDFVDHDRETLGNTEYEETVLNDKIQETKDSIDYWMKTYNKNRWENQDNYVEVWIEKKALISAFQKPCKKNNVSLSPCKGYPSLTFLDNAKNRFRIAERRDKKLIMLYFGDYDPSGEDIPRSINDTLYRMGVDVDVKRIALMEEQVLSMNLPPAPTKSGDSRTRNWDGLGQVELDAIEPTMLASMAEDAIAELFDDDKHNELLQQEREEKEIYVAQLKKYGKEL